MAAWVRSTRCNLLRILLTCPLTVFSLSTNWWAIAVLENPSATSRNTSSSRSLKSAKAGWKPKVSPQKQVNLEQSFIIWNRVKIQPGWLNSSKVVISLKQMPQYYTNLSDFYRCRSWFLQLHFKRRVKLESQKEQLSTPLLILAKLGTPSWGTG